ncbi:MAG TPA: N-succinylarginine dihydrolase [Aeromonadales bacterium]|nr:N-succinylarginine dihydrolase [Aeromonadales bacterium]
MKTYEVNFDGIVGPTHNYAGLSLGNIASFNNAKIASNPKEAALQGLEKMKALHDMGFKQGMIAPMERPDVTTLRRLGFSGSDEDVIQQTAKNAPQLLVAVSSASSMWTANACTTSASSDTADKRVHFTAANLSNKFHRSIEWQTTAQILKAIFSNENYFAHHQALPMGDHFGDEGAANFTRLCDGYGSKGLEFFVYGKQAFNLNQPAPTRFPARQTLEASEAIARLHQLDLSHTVFAQQNPQVIDSGVFHNDVIAVGNQHVLFYHELAFLNSDEVLAEIQSKYPGEKALEFIRVSSESVPLGDAISSYLFNSQLLSVNENEMLLICPGECAENPQVSKYLDSLIQQPNCIKKVEFYDVKQSMRNGGGPACLRQRVVLTEEELGQTNPRCIMDESMYKTLRQWVNKHYRDKLTAEQLADPQLLDESRRALDELTQLLDLGNVYPFQH